VKFRRRQRSKIAVEIGALGAHRAAFFVSRKTLRKSVAPRRETCCRYWLLDDTLNLLTVCHWVPRYLIEASVGGRPFLFRGLAASIRRHVG